MEDAVKAAQERLDELISAKADPEDIGAAQANLDRLLRAEEPSAETQPAKARKTR